MVRTTRDSAFYFCLKTSFLSQILFILCQLLQQQQQQQQQYLFPQPLNTVHSFES